MQNVFSIAGKIEADVVERYGYLNIVGMVRFHFAILPQGMNLKPGYKIKVLCRFLKKARNIRKKEISSNEESE